MKPNKLIAIFSLICLTASVSEGQKTGKVRGMKGENNMKPAAEAPSVSAPVSNLPFSFSKPKEIKEVPLEEIKKAESTNFALTKKQKQRADSLQKTQSQLAAVFKKFPGMPKQATFCGERVPIENESVAEKFYTFYSRYTNAGGLLSFFHKMGNRYRKDLQAAMKRNGLPNDLFYLVCVESGFANLTSSAGAKGFFQFMEETARDYGLEVSHTVDERLHPIKAADASCRYLRDLYRMTGKWTLAAAAYNAGPGTISAQGGKDYFTMNLNPETSEYVYRILSVKMAMENRGLGKGAYTPIPHIVEKVNYNILDLRQFADDCNVDYATLKIMNPWLIHDQLWAQPGKTYEIWLPAKSNQKIDADELIPLPFMAWDSGIDKQYVRDSIKATYTNLTYFVPVEVR